MKLCKVKNFQVSKSNSWSILKAFHMLSCIRSSYIWKASAIPSPWNCKALPDFRNYFVSLFPLALNSKPDKKEHLFVWRYSYPFRLSSTLSSPYPIVPAICFILTQSWTCTSSSSLLAQGSLCQQPHSTRNKHIISTAPVSHTTRSHYHQSNLNFWARHAFG